MYPPITEQGSKPDERHTVHRENPDYKKSLFLTMIYMVLLYRENSTSCVLENRDWGFDRRKESTGMLEDLKRRETSKSNNGATRT